MSAPFSEIDLLVPSRSSAADIFEVNEKVQHLFQRWLLAEPGAEARAHLSRERALPDWLVKADGLGYCGEGKRSLIVWAAKKKIPFELLVDAGLVKRSVFEVRKAFRAKRGREAGSSEELTEFFEAEIANRPGTENFYHNFPSVKTPEGKFVYGRWITIPIRKQDEEGKIRIAGFQFRSLRPAAEIGKQGRYRTPRRTISSEGTVIMDWNETMIGLAEEVEQLRRSGEVILCEGKFDQLAVKLAISSWPEESRPAVIALGGIATRGGDGEKTPEAQAGILAVLKEFGCRRATLWLDEDERGTAAILGGQEDRKDPSEQTLGVGPRLAAMGIHVSVARLADAWEEEPLRLENGEEPKDAGELLLAGGVESLLLVLQAARGRGLVSFASAQMEALLASCPTGGQLWQRLRALDRIVPTLRSMPESVRRPAIRRIVEATGLPPTAIEASLSPPGAPGRVEVPVASGRKR